MRARTTTKGRAHELTLDAWAELGREVRGELVDGALVEEEMPTYIHETTVAFLIRLLDEFLATRGGFVFGSEAKVAVGPRRGRKPDVSVFLAGARRPHGRDSIARVPPSIVVEVVTATPRDGRRDRVEKKRDYASARVEWYWLVDPQLRTLEVLQLVRGRYVDTLSVSDGRHRVPGVDGLFIDLDALWSRIDALDAKR
jgi:Uma2 family endonuclease